MLLYRKCTCKLWGSCVCVSVCVCVGGGGSVVSNGDLQRFLQMSTPFMYVYDDVRTESRTAMRPWSIYLDCSCHSPPWPIDRPLPVFSNARFVLRRLHSVRGGWPSTYTQKYRQPLSHKKSTNKSPGFSVFGVLLYFSGVCVLGDLWSPLLSWFGSYTERIKVNGSPWCLVHTDIAIRQSLNVSDRKYPPLCHQARKLSEKKEAFAIRHMGWPKGLSLCQFPHTRNLHNDAWRRAEVGWWHFNVQTKHWYGLERHGGINQRRRLDVIGRTVRPARVSRFLNGVES